MFELIRDFPNVFIPIFVAIDVFALLPVFLSLTQGMSSAGLRSVIRQSVFTAFVISISFVTLGEIIFRVIGITVDDFKIAGGILLLIIAILDIVQTDKHEKRKKATSTIGIVPIGVPLIVGPALLTTLLVLLEHYGPVLPLVALVINLIIVWFLFTRASLVVDIIGKNGILAISKLMDILLASIAVMMIRMGVENLIKQFY